MGKSMMSDDEEIEKKYQGNTRYDECLFLGMEMVSKSQIKMMA